VIAGILILSGISCTRDTSKEESVEESKQATDSSDQKNAPEGEASTPETPKSIGKDEEKATTTASKIKDYPAEIVLMSSLWKTPTKGPVKLTHKKHLKDYGVSCLECHHVYRDGKNVWEPGMAVDKCHECHDEPTVKGENSLPPGSKLRNLKLAFHKNCQGCHRTLKAENPESNAPTVCSKCHEKKGGK
jgi:hypothetical protein